MTACRLLGLALAALVAGPVVDVAALEVANVRTEPRVIVPDRGDHATVVFRLSAPAKVALQVYDGRDLLVRRIESDGQLPAGDGSLMWDGRDQAGRLVPPEAYPFTLAAEDAQAVRIEHDLTDLTGGAEVLATDVRWDAQARLIRYRLAAPARVNIRLGLKDNGPLLRTLVDWVTRDAGDHGEPWDGRDASGVLDLADHPSLAISVDAFALSDNSILIGPPHDRVLTIENLPWGEERRVERGAQAKRMHFHAQQPLETRGDYRIGLTLPTGLAIDAEGLPMVSGTVPIRLDIHPDDRDRALSRRFEPVFFVDGSFAFENEVGFLPMTWRWDSRGVNPGVHVLSANLRGYEGNFGMATIRIRVQAAETDEQPE